LSVKKCEGVRLIEQTGIPHGNYSSGSYISPFSFTPWVNSWSDWAFFFGQDTVAEAIVVPEEIGAKIPTAGGLNAVEYTDALGAVLDVAQYGLTFVKQATAAICPNA
jgi:hypothetical protein